MFPFTDRMQVMTESQDKKTYSFNKNYPRFFGPRRMRRIRAVTD
jgi:hypothetical protein